MQPKTLGLTVLATMFVISAIPVGSFAGNAEAASSSGVIWKTKFSERNWKTPWDMRPSFGMDNLDIKKEGGNKFLRVKYPKYSASPSYARSEHKPIGGAQFKGEPVRSRDAIHLSYDVRFPHGFDFVKGGKLPGLYGGDGNTGGKIPNGRDGWSTRIMWRAGGTGEMYAYLPTSKTWGTEIGKGAWKFKADGKWHNIEQEIKLNTPGKKNGYIKIWYDGKLVVKEYGLKFRTTSKLKIDGVLFSTFFGGQSKAWRTPKYQHADFDNFILGYKYIGTRN